FCLYYSLILSASICAQDFPYAVRHYGVSQGLSNEWVSDIAQDDNGYLWLGTQYGLSRFDGHSFKIYTYRPDGGLSSNWVRGLHVSEQGLLLAPLGQGVQLLDNESGRFSASWQQKGWGSSSVRDVEKWDTKSVLVSSSAGVFLWPLSSDTINKAAPKLVLEGSYFDLGIQDDLWAAAGSGGIFISSGDITHQIHESSCRSIGFIGRDSLLSQGMRALFLSHRQTNGSWITENLTTRLLTEAPTNGIEPFFYCDRQNQFWIPTVSGLLCLNRRLEIIQQISTNQLFAEAGLTGNGQLLSFFQDREGSYWIGTDRGVFQLLPRVSFRQGLLSGINDPLERTREIVTHGDTLWLVRPGGIYQYIDQIDLEPQLLISGRFQALLADFKGQLYAFNMSSSPASLLRIRTSDSYIETVAESFPTVGSSENWSMDFDHEGRVWISRQNDLLCFDPKRNSSFVLSLVDNEQTLTPYIIDVLIDDRNQMWLATIYAGLVKIENLNQYQADGQASFRQYLHDPEDPGSLSNSLVQQIHQTDEGTIWVASDGGLHKMHDDQNGFERFLRNDLMPDDKAMAITSDEKGRIWFSTISHGIIGYDPTNDRYETLGEAEGLLGEAMFLSSVWRDEEGYLYFGGQAGLQAFHPDSISMKPTAPPKLFWELEERQRGDTFLTTLGPDVAQSYSLTASDISWRVKFSAPTFTHPENWRYRFKLEGHHIDWLPWQASGELRLSQLPKGKYRLLVEATDQSERTPLRFSPIQLRVWPPWYFSNLAYLIYGLFILSLIYWFYQLQLRQRLAEARQAQTALASAERLKLFNQVAHEFRTPLTIIQAAMDRLKNEQTPDTDKRLKQIDQQSKHLQLQVTQILDLAATQYGHNIEQLDHGDFVAYLNHLLNSFSSSAEQQQTTLKFQTDIDSLIIQYPPDSWRKIINNLVGNALKYCPNGSRIEMQVKYSDPGKLQVIISDNGPGIAPTFQTKIFEPFTRERSNHKEGSGIGLALVKELIEGLNGHISVESALGQGSNFIVEVPVKPLPTSEPTMPAEVGDRPIVFIAEDQAEIIEYLRYFLRDSYQVLSAGDGQTAWEKCLEHPPDLLISDIIMPGIDGLELCHRMKSHEATDHVPVILLTARAGAASRHAGLSQGADAYLPKPFDRTEL
ncbi:MAG: ATP-binding protein, partial [Bacteroidota bacterium]